MRDKKKKGLEVKRNKKVEADIPLRLMLSILGGIYYWLLLYFMGFSDSMNFWGINFYPFMLIGFPVIIYNCVKVIKKII